MRNHLSKAKHNEEFLKLIEDSIKDDFFDWKITISFYSALHYLKAFLKLKKVRVGNTHTELDNIINPDNKNKKISIPVIVYENYQELLNNSRNSRYEAYKSGTFQILLSKVKKDESKVLLKNLKKYFKSEGLKI